MLQRPLEYNESPGPAVHRGISKVLVSSNLRVRNSDPKCGFLHPMHEIGLAPAGLAGTGTRSEVNAAVFRGKVRP